MRKAPLAKLPGALLTYDDGRLDVAAGGSVCLAKPGGGFYPAQNIWIGGAGAQGVADFNRDGKADLLSGLSILLQK